MDERNVLYIREFKIEECKYIKALLFDFAVFNQDKLVCLIEYQGRQHYEATDFFGGEKEFKLRKKRDDIKRMYCKEQRIPLIEVPYTISDIKEYVLYQLDSVMSEQLNLNI
ncbi:DUF2726 domain-containing protein [Bacillus wiedmannii]|uniref:DUF2726 domain-containing protein n=1 Tax=Bacillus wiedmannii TaxID=1890302 RepID=UPI0015967D86|nr:DUF2726 domain-containing protein [Bacillus wiedmannii]